VTFGINGNSKTLFGMDTGMIADENSPAFTYLLQRPRNWRESFGILTFRDGKLLMPELVLKWGEGVVQFRGELIICLIF
jgi:hypothetical protein